MLQLFVNWLTTGSVSLTAAFDLSTHYTTNNYIPHLWLRSKAPHCGI